MIENLITDRELELLLELLQSERHELGPEIHHTTSMQVKAELRERMLRVDGLLAQLRALQTEQRSVRDSPESA